jgi:hypothetical protein
MSRLGSIILIAVFLSSGGLVHSTMAGQSARSKLKTYPLWDFDERGHTCRAKGRLQDRGYCSSRLMDQIVADGKDAIPILISQLTDARPTKEPIYDFWALTTAGDIAYFILSNLFTDANWTTFNMPGLESLNDKCDSYAQECWRRFLKKHGRKFVQDQWLAAWNKNKDRIYWDQQARCFRLYPDSKIQPAPGNQ